MRTTYREKRYYCGEYLDVYIYPTYSKPGKRRKKSKPTSATQAALNQKHRAEKLTRLMHANFTPDDYEIHLTYAEQPESPERAKKDLQNYLDRVRRLRKKAGLDPLKYIAVTERGKNGRYHHHITLNGGISRDALENKWGFGYANTRRLQFTENGIAGLARYIIKDPIFAKAWNASKNLIDPEPKTRDGRISGRAVKELMSDPEACSRIETLNPGYKTADIELYHNEVNGGFYICARMYKQNSPFITAKRKRRMQNENRDISDRSGQGYPQADVPPMP